MAQLKKMDEMDSNDKKMGLLEDRIKFKLYAAEQHLNKLKEIDKEHNNIFIDRVNAEIEIDCFFAQIIGAKDFLLVFINDKLNLGLRIEDVCLLNINYELKKINKQNIIEELNKLSSCPSSEYPTIAISCSVRYGSMLFF